jgi:diguanylate cyclase (GGDEF)-like protein/PAS domain S-box-containing protein
VNSATQDRGCSQTDREPVGAKLARRPLAIAALLAAAALGLPEPIAAATSPAIVPAAAGVLARAPSLALVLGILLAIGVLAAAAVAAILLHRRAGKAVEEARRLTSLFDVVAEGILVCSGMQVIAANTSICRQAGIDAGEIGDLMISSFIRDADAIDSLLSDRDIQLETQIHARDGRTVEVEIGARTIHYAGAPRRLLEIRDIGERKQTQERVSFLAHHDVLTGLPNRDVLQARLAQCIEEARPCAIIWVDLDRFKQMNDVHGHAMGDRILRTVAEKLKFELPAGTVVARFGGDEFVVLYENIQDSLEARLVGQQLRRLLNRSIDLGERHTTVGASVGVAVYPYDAATADDLLKNADLALHHAKAGGRGKARQYTEALGQERQRRMALSAQLRGAIENGDIQAFFQPLVHTRDLRACGFETLGRWFHPEFGAVPPPEFVRLAEENGLIDPLTDLMIRRAVDAARQWPDDVRVSVNVSPIQLNSEFVDRVREIIKSSSLDPSRLELEVTEDVLIKDFEQTASMFARLRALGIQVAMDDFGAGYTSMGNLRRLNFERIKIDRIFTMDLPNHRRSAAIVRSMFVLARELNLDVTVEGVETQEQLAFLRDQGCTEVQGFLFSQAKPLSAFADPASLKFELIAPAPPQPAAVSAALIELGERRSKRAS